MAQEWKVTRAFRGTVEGDKNTPEVIHTQAGDCHKYLVQVENQPVPGWFQVLRKIENGQSKPVNQGDTLYGEINENNYGKPDFKRVNRPYEGQPQQAPQAQPAAAPAQTYTPPQQPSTELEAKVDYLISLVENFLDSQQGTQPAGAAPGATDNDDDAPVNLDNLDY